MVVQILLNAHAAVVVDIAEDVEQVVGVADGHARCDRCFHAAHAAGVRDGHAVDVFDDVAAHRGDAAVGLGAERFGCQRRGVGNGDRLGAAGGYDQLVVQDVNESLIRFFADMGLYSALIGRTCSHTFSSC